MNPAGQRERFWVRWGLDPVRGVIDGLTVDMAPDRGVIHVEASGRPPADLAQNKIYGDHVLTPGFLNAHAHLDYSYLKGALPRGEGFIPWLKAMIRSRRAFGPNDEPAAIADASDAVAHSLADGVTEIWDIRSFGWGEAALKDARCAGISFHEWIAPDPKAWEKGWPEFLDPLQRSLADNQAGTIRLKIGLSVHSMYSVCAEAAERATAWGLENMCPLAVHLAESPEEIELLTEGRGGLHQLLCGFPRPRRFRHMTRSRRPPISRALDYGMLTPATLMIHCNLPQTGEAEILAESGVAVVFCPGSHAFFGYPEYPLDAYKKLGVRLALGTDSLASNDSLSMRAEARRLISIAPSWSPQDVLACLTGAMLGDLPPYGGRGRLIASPCTSWALWQPAGLSQSAHFDQLLASILSPATPLVASSVLPFQSSS